MEKITTLKILNTKTELFYKGSDRLSYKFFYDNELVSEGSDFLPSPIFGIDSIETAVSCLSFMTVKQGDTDKDFFKDHTEKHLKFLETYDCNELRLIISDFEDLDSEYYYNAKKFLKKGFKVIT